MKYLNLLALSALLSLSGITLTAELRPSNAPVQSSAQEKAARLHSQLSEVEAKQSELQTRLRDLEEKLKPEDIEHSLAGVGSTHPEDLREQRRRQLEIERNGVRAQLDLLATSHSRMETALAQADADAYRQSADVVTTPVVSLSTTSPTISSTLPNHPRRVSKKKTKKSKRTARAAKSQ